MNKGRFVLGIDTSNYKTSLCIISGDKIICDKRRFLKVKEGDRGLRQSEALFQHINNLPEMFEEIREEFAKTGAKHPELAAVAYSSAPRPVKGSYMPCFLAGKCLATSIASVLSIPVADFSHQEGHIEAIRGFVGEKIENKFLACHFSGGTLEVLKVNTKKDGYDIEIIGGTKDISFGQVLDRIGVSLGLAFPCGEQLDKVAMVSTSVTHILSSVPVKEGEINLSGFESQIQRYIKKEQDLGKKNVEILSSGLIKEVFEVISDSILKMLMQISAKAGAREIIMSGGVSSSGFIRQRLRDKLADNSSNKINDNGIKLLFDEKDLSSDNAVGIALLGSRSLWG